MVRDDPWWPLNSFTDECNRHKFQKENVYKRQQRGGLIDRTLANWKCSLHLKLQTTLRASETWRGRWTLSRGTNRFVVAFCCGRVRGYKIAFRLERSEQSN